MGKGKKGKRGSDSSDETASIAAAEKLGLPIEPYLSGREHWPTSGQHILAGYDSDTIAVYQAFKPEIGRYAATHNKFDGAPGYTRRMTWVKTNFLWMTYRSGWGSKVNQECVLRIRVTREWFTRVLEAACTSGNKRGRRPGKQQQHRNTDRVGADGVDAVGDNSHTTPSSRNKKKEYDGWTGAVRLQWDPDHQPRPPYTSTRRRAIQLGLKGCWQADIATGDAVVDITDITEFVKAARPTSEKADLSKLWVPIERVYTPETHEALKSVETDAWEPCKVDCTDGRCGCHRGYGDGGSGDGDGGGVDGDDDAAGRDDDVDGAGNEAGAGAGNEAGAGAGAGAGAAT